MVLVGTSVNDEDQSIVVFDLLHRSFGSQRVLDDVESIHAVKKTRFH